MKKIKFKIVLKNILTNETKIEEKEGYQIDSITAIYRDYRCWIVSDLNCGLAVCKGKTKKEAIDKYIKIKYTTYNYRLHYEDYQDEEE